VLWWAIYDYMDVAGGAAPTGWLRMQGHMVLLLTDYVTPLAIHSSNLLTTTFGSVLWNLYPPGPVSPGNDSFY